jgi:hypothetical protein
MHRSGARYVLVSMTVASIVVFAAAWNSMEAGWGIRRLRIAQAALLSLDCNAEQRTVNGTLVTQPDADCVLKKARLTAFYPSPDRGQPWTYFTREEIEQGHEWLRNYRFSRPQLTRHIQNMQDSLINDVFKVRVPSWELRSISTT